MNLEWVAAGMSLCEQLVVNHIHQDPDLQKIFGKLLCSSQVYPKLLS